MKLEMLQSTHEKTFEEAKFDLFCKIMDKRREEQKEIEKKWKEGKKHY